MLEYMSSLLIDHSRINYEIKNFGSSVICVTSSISQQEIDDAVRELKSMYEGVGIDCHGDIVING